MNSSSLDTASAVDTGRSSPVKMWGPVAALAMGTFAYVTTEFIPVGVLPEVAKSFGISTGDAGLMLTMPGILAAISAPLVLLLAGNLNRRLLVIFLCSLLVIACGLSAIAPNFGWMLVGRALFGFGLGGFWTLAIAMPSSLVPEHLVAKATAVVFAGVSVGFIIGVPIGTFVGDLFGWRATFVAVGVMGLATVISQCIFLPSMPVESRMSLADLRRFCMSPKAQASMLILILTYAGHFSTYTFIAPMLLKAGVAAERITFVLLGIGVVGLLANVIVSRYLPHRVYGALIATMAMAAIALLALPAVDIALVPVMIALALWGAAWGALPLCLSTFHRSAATGSEDASSVMFIVAGQVAIAGGSGLGGAIVDHMGLLSVFLCGGGVFTVAIAGFAVYQHGASGSK